MVAHVELPCHTTSHHPLGNTYYEPLSDPFRPLLTPLVFPIIIPLLTLSPTHLPTPGKLYPTAATNWNVTLTSVQYSIGSGSGSGGLSGNVASGLVVFAVPNEGLSGLLSFDLNQVCMVPMRF